MDRRAAPPAIVPDPVYMVESYRAASPGAERPRALPAPDDATVLGVIDIPGDEIALHLISAPDAATAERIVRDGGMRPIRVVPVQWDPGDGTSASPSLAP